MKKVLIVAYGFPPVGGAGVQRPVKFVKYLRNFGWEPVVLTVANPSVPVIDESLMKDIPEGVKVFKARTFEPSYQTKKQYSHNNTGIISRIRRCLKNIAANFLLPDIQVLWWPSLINMLFSIMRLERPGCIFVTAPPFSSFVPVVAIGKVFRVPVVIDFRDEWSFSRQQWEQAIKTPLAFWVDRVLEKFTISHCSQFSAANASYVNSLREAYPEVSKDKGVVITNGYDSDDFMGVVKSPKTGELVTFVYAGTVWNATSLLSFSAALKQIAEEYPRIATRIKVKIFGRVVDEHSSYLTDDVIKSMVEIFGYVDHEYVVEQICNADVLLLTLADLPGSYKIIAAKVFELMFTGKHILAMVSDGELKNILLENYPQSTIVAPGDIDEICNRILWIMKNVDEIRSTAPSDVSSFSRKHLAGKLASVFDEVIQKGHAA